MATNESIPQQTPTARQRFAAADGDDNTRLDQGNISLLLSAILAWYEEQTAKAAYDQFAAYITRSSVLRDVMTSLMSQYARLMAFTASQERKFLRLFYTRCRSHRAGYLLTPPDSPVTSTVNVEGFGAPRTRVSKTEDVRVNELAISAIIDGKTTIGVMGLFSELLSQVVYVLFNSFGGEHFDRTELNDAVTSAADARDANRQHPSQQNLAAVKQATERVYNVLFKALRAERRDYWAKYEDATYERRTSAEFMEFIELVVELFDILTSDTVGRAFTNIDAELKAAVTALREEKNLKRDDMFRAKVASIQAGKKPDAPLVAQGPKTLGTKLPPAPQVNPWATKPKPGGAAATTPRQQASRPRQAAAAPPASLLEYLANCPQEELNSFERLVAAARQQASTDVEFATPRKTSRPRGNPSGYAMSDEEAATSHRVDANRFAVLSTVPGLGDTPAPSEDETYLGLYRSS